MKKTELDLDLTVFEWFKQNRSLNIPINELILFKKAEQFAVLHYHTNFKPSWIYRWKKRFSISFVIMNDESEKIDSEAVENWLERLKTIIALHKPSKIFKADETGLFSSACQKKHVLMGKYLMNVFQFYSQLV